MRSNSSAPTTGVCEVCGATFVLRGAQAKKGARYCSRRCYGQTLRRPAPDARICEQCGASFTPTRNALRNRNYQGRYCSIACSNVARERPLVERFWEKVDRRGPDDCWPWLAGTDGHGYGAFTVSPGQQRAAHVVAYELATGKMLEAGIFGCHTCDNPPCCNPAHVFPGTPADNAHDRDAKGRTARGNAAGARLHPERLLRGSKHGRAKLTDADIPVIRRLYEERRMSQQAIADEYNVSQVVISAVVRRVAWKHIE